MVDGPLTGNAFTRMAGGVLPRVDDFLLGGATGAMINQGRNLYDSAGNLVAVARGDMTEDEFAQRGQDMLQRDTSTGVMFPGAVGKAGLVVSPAVAGAQKMAPALGARVAPLAAVAQQYPALADMATGVAGQITNPFMAQAPVPVPRPSPDSIAPQQADIMERVTTGPEAGPLVYRANNPGGINAAAWVQNMPGYIGSYEGTAGNATAVFETPSHGASALAKRVSFNAGDDLQGYIKGYGGSGQNYLTSGYFDNFLSASGLSPDAKIDPNNDQQMFAILKGHIAAEGGAGQFSDEDIASGIAMFRGEQGQGEAAPPARGLSGVLQRFGQRVQDAYQQPMMDQTMVAADNAGQVFDEAGMYANSVAAPLLDPVGYDRANPNTGLDALFPNLRQGLGNYRDLQDQSYNEDGGGTNITLSEGVDALQDIWSGSGTSDRINAENAAARAEAEILAQAAASTPPIPTQRPTLPNDDASAIVAATSSNPPVMQVDFSTAKVASDVMDDLGLSKTPINAAEAFRRIQNTDYAGDFDAKEAALDSLFNAGIAMMRAASRPGASTLESLSYGLEALGAGIEGRRQQAEADGEARRNQDIELLKMQIADEQAAFDRRLAVVKQLNDAAAEARQATMDNATLQKTLAQTDAIRQGMVGSGSFGPSLQDRRLVLDSAAKYASERAPAPPAGFLETEEEAEARQQVWESYYNEFLQRLGMDPANTLFFGDSVL